ncbi:MAG: MgtC/SapB family protein [Caldilineaceae bacterium]
MEQVIDITSTQMLLRLLMAALIGGVIGFERRARHKPIGIAGMMLVAIGSASYMMLAMYLSAKDPAAISRALQGLLQGIGFLGGAVIFKTGTTVQGIKTAAAIWITGAIGLAIGTWFWVLGVIVGLATALILYVTDDLLAAKQQTREEDAPTQLDSRRQPALDKKAE